MCDIMICQYTKADANAYDPQPTSTADRMDIMRAHLLLPTTVNLSHKAICFGPIFEGLLRSAIPLHSLAQAPAAPLWGVGRVFYILFRHLTAEKIHQ